MNKQEIEIAKKIAEIEGVCDTVDREGMPHRIVEILGKIAPLEYDPFFWLILGPLMVKYEVSIEHPCEYVFITQGWSQVSTGFSDKSEIPRAILECIIKSKED